ncbi:polyamine-transporting ATPase [Nocardioides psychrotolerans]|uniref:Spermidine/putrescine transport system ATP-binding protein/putrescine transport system ATP-binding protein n=1 Tax=Nocardioides psychrotolerans TaxID=1005945 RepID=A0A1I3PB70_9ACTN|nr:ABC transporter ATP-binding protein [Nocardioides psychrotolerans]GEP39633.1 polyamine-transporting ATPase [Nocardioides psychrotolerans]SFJ18669.1 spermidine/putrescine transport system ATP-binding protein/putrescine transport system ATP-binding protein [Nocardioides psychrotolerans]
MTQSTTPGVLLEVREASRSFGHVRALDSVSLTIAENEFFALLGPSGCGKTTLLRSIAGFEHPDSGAILLGGRDLLALPPNKRPVNLMFQSYALFPHLSVASNVAYGLKREKLPKAEVTQRVAEVLDTVGLQTMADRRPAQLSGGQRQRVALARAIVKRPRLLLLDEPLSALDRKVRAEMQLELKRLQHEVGITFVVVTHDQEEAMSMADRIAVLAEGRVQQVASPLELYRHPANLFVADFIGTSNLLAGPSDRERLMVRPEDARLVTPGEGTLSGTVLDTQFQGGTSTVAVEVSTLAKPFLVCEPGATAAVRGTEVGLVWDHSVVVGEGLA